MYQNYITTIKTHLVLINKIPFGLLIVSFYKNVVYYFFIVPILDINKIPVLTSWCFFVEIIESSIEEFQHEYKKL